MNPLEVNQKIHEVLTSEEIMKRQRLQDLQPGKKRTYTPHFREMIEKAETVGDVVKALKKAGSTYGLFSDMPPELYQKIESAKKCKVKLSEIPAIG